jgi:hypothetical protein
MKVTVDLPEGLVKKVKLRAVHDGRKLKDTVQELLVQGLSVDLLGAKAKKRKPRLVTNPKTGFPEIDCGSGSRRSTLTMEQHNELIRRIEEEQDLESVGISVRR